MTETAEKDLNCKSSISHPSHWEMIQYRLKYYSVEEHVNPNNQPIKNWA